jgi:hypothetical protein
MPQNNLEKALFPRRELTADAVSYNSSGLSFPRRRFLTTAGYVTVGALASAGALYASFSAPSLAFAKTLEVVAEDATLAEPNARLNVVEPYSSALSRVRSAYVHAPDAAPAQLQKQATGQAVEQTVTTTTTTSSIAATPIRPALIEPLIDGQYTPVDNLQLTALGKTKVAEDPSWMPTTEWVDGDDRRLDVYRLDHVAASYPEVYMSRKFYRNDANELHYSMTLDAVSDKQVLKGDHMTIIFKSELQNIDDQPGAPGVFSLELWYPSNSPESLTRDTRFKSPGTVFPSDMAKYKSTLAPSPHSPDNHKIIEFDFDLGIVLDYFKSTGKSYEPLVTDFHLASFSLIRNTGTTPYPAYSVFNSNDWYETISISDETLPVSEPLGPATLGAAAILAGAGTRYLKKMSRRKLLHLPETQATCSE